MARPIAQHRVAAFQKQSERVQLRALVPIVFIKIFLFAFVDARVLPIIGDHFEEGTFPADLIPEIAKLGNISTRALVGTNSNILIAGFILSGNGANDQIVVRAQAYEAL